MFRSTCLLVFLILSVLVLAWTPGCHPSDTTENELADDDDDDDNDDNDDNGDGDLRITFFDVGLGDAVLVESPDGTRMLVDGGSVGEGQYTICPHLEDSDISRIDLMVLTHPHFDHAGGLSEVFDCVEVGDIWTNGKPLDEDAYNLFADAVDVWGGEVTVPDQGDMFDLGSEAQVQVLNSGGGYEGDEVVAVNNDSLVLLVEWTGVRLLLTGDVDLAEQEDLVADFGASLQADILKIPNHAKGPHSESFVDTVDAAYAVCSVGPNELGYPSQETLIDYEDTGADLFVTEIDGTARLTFNGDEIEVSTGL